MGLNSQHTEEVGEMVARYSCVLLMALAALAVAEDVSVSLDKDGTQVTPSDPIHTFNVKTADKAALVKNCQKQAMALALCHRASELMQAKCTKKGVFSKQADAKKKGSGVELGEAARWNQPQL